MTGVSSFAEIFVVDHFIDAFHDEVSIVKELPSQYPWSTREYYAAGIRDSRIKTAPVQFTAKWYIENVLPALQKSDACTYKLSTSLGKALKQCSGDKPQPVHLHWQVYGRNIPSSQPYEDYSGANLRIHFLWDRGSQSACISGFCGEYIVINSSDKPRWDVFLNMVPQCWGSDFLLRVNPF